VKGHTAVRSFEDLNELRAKKKKKKEKKRRGGVGGLEEGIGHWSETKARRCARVSVPFPSETGLFGQN